jgi:hypothetical protein
MSASPNARLDTEHKGNANKHGDNKSTLDGNHLGEQVNLIDYEFRRSWVGIRVLT